MSEEEEFEFRARAEAESKGYTSSVSEFGPAAVEMGRDVVGGAFGRAAENLGNLVTYPFTGGEGSEDRSKRIAQNLKYWTGTDLSKPEAKAGGLATDFGLAALGPNLVGKGAGVILSNIPKTRGIAQAAEQAISKGGFGPMKDYGKNRMTQVANKVLAGGIAGGSGAAMVDPESMGMGTALGAASPFAIGGAGYLGKQAARFPDWLLELAGGVRSKVQAGKIMRDAAGKELPAIESVLSSSGSVPAGEATAGIYAPTFQALNREAGKLRPTQTGTRAIGTAQAEEQQIAQLAGGADQTAAGLFRKDQKDKLNKTTQLLARRAIHRVNKAGKETTYWEREAAAARKRIDEISSILNAKDASGNYTINALPLNLSVQNVEARAVQKLAQDKLQDLENRGLGKLNIDELTGYLDNTAATPGTRADDLQKGVLVDLSSNVRELAKLNGGIIDAEDLYQIRKTGINDLVDKFLTSRGLDPIANKKRAAELVGQAKKYIDEAITKAGGKEWKKYLADYTGGSHRLDQHEMASVLQDVYRTSPDEFVRIMDGNATDIVERMFGYGRTDIKKEMGTMYPTLKRISDRIKSQTKTGKVSEQLSSMEAQAEQGSANLRNILSQNKDGWQILTSMLAEKAGAGTTVRALSLLEGQMPSETMELIADAMQSSKTANDLMKKLPITVFQKLVEGLQYAVRTGTIAAGAPAMKEGDLSDFSILP